MRMQATITSLSAAFDVTVFVLASRTRISLPPGDGAVTWRVSRRFPLEAERLRSRALRWLHEPGGHPSDGWFSEAVLSELLAILDEVRPRVVVLESLGLQRYLAPLRERGWYVVLNAHGIEAILHEELAKRSPSTLACELAKRTGDVEGRAFLAADQLWVTSPHDAALVSRLYGREQNVAIVPNVIDLDDYPEPANSGADGFTVAYTGVYAYPPNAAAADRLTVHILPLLRERIPDARLALIGQRPTARMEAAARADEWIEVTGAVDDVAPHLVKASAMAVPLAEGHGTRFKVLEAFAMRLPVVSTHKGVEGLELETGTHYLPAESDAEFVEALARLARDPDAGGEVTEPAFDLVSEHYSLTAARERVMAALASTMG